jgi:acetyl-CoA/propionyl-CoA carboxylase biotin carboxyl carrier protein
MALVKISAKAGERVFSVDVERQDGKYIVDVDGARHEVDAQKLEGDFYTIILENRSFEVSVEHRGDAYHVRHGAAEQSVTFSDPSRRARDGQAVADGPEEVVSAMPGRVVRILVSEGDVVEPGQGVIVIEAMKMENEITASKGGRVTTIDVADGQSVENGARLLVIE